MANISVSLPSDGSTADAADLSSPINTIVNEFNGNIDNSNIKSGAAIATSKLADDAGITTAKIADGAVTDAKWRNGVAFGGTSNQSMPTGATNVTTYTEVFDVGANFNHTTGIFTVPVNGIYHFSATSGIDNSITRVYTYIYKNSAVLIGFASTTADAGNQDPAASVSVTTSLSAGDTVYMNHYHESAVTANLSLGSGFSGFLVTRT